MRKKSNTLTIVLVVILVLAFIISLQVLGVINLSPTLGGSICRELSKDTLSSRTKSSIINNAPDNYKDVYGCLDSITQSQVLTILGGPANCGCPTDLNNDGVVNSADLAVLLGAWGENPGHPADFTGDGVVNSADLAVLLGAWGPCPTTEISCMDSCDNDEDNLIDCADVLDCQVGAECENGGTCMSGVCVICGDGVCSEGETQESCADCSFGECTLNTKLLASDGASSDEFGEAVDIEQGWAFVGVEKDDDDGSSSGSVYVFKLNEVGQWVQVQKLHADDATAGDLFGTSVSISGNAVVIGAKGDDDLGSGAGAAYVFKLNEVGQWVQVQKLLASDGGGGDAGGDQFGKSVSISGNVIVVGAQLEDGDTFYNSGAAYVFRYNGNSWVEEQKLHSDCQNACGANFFGNSVAISNNEIIIGESFADYNGYQSGSAFIFFYGECDSSHSGFEWCLEEKLLASDGLAGDYFGRSVDISGDKAIVGAPNSGNSGGGAENGYGSIYIYTHNENSWEETKITASDGTVSDWFGWSVSMSNGNIIVGAPKYDGNGFMPGSVYVYTQSGANWVEEQKILAADGAGGDYFGWSIDISSDTVVIGARGDDDMGDFSGSAYIFDCSAT